MEEMTFYSLMAFIIALAFLGIYVYVHYRVTKSHSLGVLHRRWKSGSRFGVLFLLTFIAVCLSYVGTVFVFWALDSLFNLVLGVDSFWYTLYALWGVESIVFIVGVVRLLRS